MINPKTVGATLHDLTQDEGLQLLGFTQEVMRCCQKAFGSLTVKDFLALEPVQVEALLDKTDFGVWFGAWSSASSLISALQGRFFDLQQTEPEAAQTTGIQAKLESLRALSEGQSTTPRRPQSSTPKSSDPAGIKPLEDLKANDPEYVQILKELEELDGFQEWLDQTSGRDEARDWESSLTAAEAAALFAIPEATSEVEAKAKAYLEYIAQDLTIRPSQHVTGGVYRTVMIGPSGRLSKAIVLERLILQASATCRQVLSPDSVDIKRASSCRVDLSRQSYENLGKAVLSGKISKHEFEA